MSDLFTGIVTAIILVVILLFTKRIDHFISNFTGYAFFGAKPWKNLQKPIVLTANDDISKLNVYSEILSNDETAKIDRLIEKIIMKTDGKVLSNNFPPAQKIPAVDEIVSVIEQAITMEETLGETSEEDYLGPRNLLNEATAPLEVNATALPLPLEASDAGKIVEAAKVERAAVRAAKQPGAVDVMEELEEETFAMRTVSGIDDEEVTFILSLFVQELNRIASCTFSLLEKGNITLKLGGTEDRIRKEYKLPIFLYEKQFHFTKKVIIHTDILQYSERPGILTIKKIELPKRTASDVDPLLPPAFEPETDVNTITDSNGFFKIKNSLGLFTPYLTSYNDVTVTTRDQALEKQRRIKAGKLRKQYSCFGVPDSFGINTRDECYTFGGVWDREVQNDSECPMFQSNLNYENNRGGSRNGYCELPSGLLNKGYRFFETNPEKSAPLCYNCKTSLIGQGTLGRCCTNQKDKRLYPYLKSPDYKFPGDVLDRQHNEEELLKLGMSII